MNNRNTSQDPEYEGPTFHEKKFHKTHFGKPDVKLLRRKDGDTKQINGTLYIWRAGRWSVKDG